MYFSGSLPYSLHMQNVYELAQNEQGRGDWLRPIRTVNRF